MAAKQNHGRKNANTLSNTMHVSPADHPDGN